MNCNNIKPPKHVAIIMDGNGRWAKQQNKERIEGHLAGAQTAKKIVIAALKAEVKSLSLFAFSSENFHRPQDEVNGLMQLFVEVIKQEINELKENGIRLMFIGQRDALPESVQSSMAMAEEFTRSETRMQLVVALNYGGRWDILQAVNKLLQRIEKDGVQSQVVDEDMLTSFLSTHHGSEPDLLIRTSGEQRISNFFLWQLAYTELYFTDVLWPEFDEELFNQALLAYQHRQRRFGVLEEDVVL